MRTLYCESLADWETFAVEVRAALDPSGKPPTWLGYLNEAGVFVPNPAHVRPDGHVEIAYPFTDGEQVDLNEWNPAKCRVLDKPPEGWKAVETDADGA